MKTLIEITKNKTMTCLNPKSTYAFLLLFLILLSSQFLIAQEDVNSQLLNSINDSRISQLQAYIVDLDKISELENSTKLAELEKQRILDSLDAQRITGLTKRLEILEKKVVIIEDFQSKSSKLQDTLRRIEEKREELEKTTVQTRYLSAMQIANRIKDESGDLDALFEWESAINTATSLTNPNEFSEFKSGLKSLQDNQKKGFKLPELDFLQSPFVNTVVSFISAVAPKDKQEERASKLKSLNCILDFTIKAKQQLDFINTETEFLKRLNDDLVERSDSLAKILFDLVNLSPSDLSVNDFEGYKIKMNKSFINSNREQIEKNIFLILELRQEYQNSVSAAINALSKVKYALSQIEADCSNVEMAKTKELIEDKKSELVDKVEKAEKSLIKNFKEELSQQKVYLLLAPSISSSVFDVD